MVELSILMNRIFTNVKTCFPWVILTKKKNNFQHQFHSCNTNKQQQKYPNRENEIKISPSPTPTTNSISSEMPLPPLQPWKSTSFSMHYLTGSLQSSMEFCKASPFAQVDLAQYTAIQSVCTPVLGAPFLQSTQSLLLPDFLIWWCWMKCRVARPLTDPAV